MEWPNTHEHTYEDTHTRHTHATHTKCRNKQEGRKGEGVGKKGRQGRLKIKGGGEGGGKKEREGNCFRGASGLKRVGPHPNNARSARLFAIFSSTAKGQTTQTSPLAM